MSVYISVLCIPSHINRSIKGVAAILETFMTLYHSHMSTSRHAQISSCFLSLDLRSAFSPIVAISYIAVVSEHKSRVLHIFHILAIMSVGMKSCLNCSQQNHYRRQICVNCGLSLSLSRGRHSGTTQEVGYGIGHSGGRPSGTTRESGYGVGHSGGRPSGTTQEAGYSVGRGRPHGRP